MGHNIVFDMAYYQKVMDEFGYDPLKFGRIDFSLGSLTEQDLQRRWICHNDADIFAKGLNNHEKAIVSTGIGLSGNPHIGTLSQILSSITLQKAGIPVNVVLGDLDAYNGKAIPLAETLELAKKYEEFISELGFVTSPPSMLRSQYGALDVLRTAYIIGNYMDDDMFNKCEEDLHEFYSQKTKVDKDMSYRRKLSLNLMIADFIHLYTDLNFRHVLVTVGIDEHKYVCAGRDTVKRMKLDPQLKDFNMTIGGMYSTLIKGLNNYPKMSKSFPDSGIRLDMNSDEIRKKISEGEGMYDKPENNVIYQMMASASFISIAELKRNYELCNEGNIAWEKAKRDYVDMLIDICLKWKRLK